MTGLEWGVTPIPDIPDFLAKTELEPPRLGMQAAAELGYKKGQGWGYICVTRHPGTWEHEEAPLVPTRQSLRPER